MNQLSFLSTDDIQILPRLSNRDEDEQRLLFHLCIKDGSARLHPGLRKAFASLKRIGAVRKSLTGQTVELTPIGNKMLETYFEYQRSHGITWVD